MSNLKNKLQQILTQLPDSKLLTAQEILPLLDLTCLNESASMQEIQTLIKHGVELHVAAICLYPQYLSMIPIKKVSVVNFPSGEDDHNQVLKDIRNILPIVDEVDYVFSYQTYLAGYEAIALTHCMDAYNLCHQHGKIFKVILETGAIPSLELIYKISTEIINNGCDFLKTSTGKIAIGASIPAAFAMLSAIVDTKSNCGIKISGGVKTLEQATEFITLAQYMLKKHPAADWLRIGTSNTNWSKECLNIG